MSPLAVATRRTASDLPALPRVNLLPPEIGERRHLKNVQLGLGAAVVVACGIVGALYVLAGASVSSATEQVTAADADHGRLVQQTATYDEVRGVYAKAAAAQATLGRAMGQEVRYSLLLDELSRQVPDHVFLKTITFTQTDLGAAPVGLPGAPGGTGIGIGTVTATGLAYEHDDVARWLDALGATPTYAGAYLSSSAESLLGKRKVVDWSSSATLQPTALSGRFTKPVGG